MTDIKLTIVPQRSALLDGHSTELHALIRVQAPALPTGADFKRRPLNLALVLDRSGSMNGPAIKEARRCADFIVDSLSAEDRLALVVYDDNIDVLAPTAPLTDKARLKAAIAGVFSRGMTDLFGGWQAGAGEAARADVPPGYISRVLLLSDGCANVGLTDSGDIAKYCAEKASQGISTSTYGLSQHFNEELMVEMARAGQGRSYYGESAEDLMDPFQEEFELLSALCARQLRLRIQPADGVTMEVLNDYRQVDNQAWQLPDLAYGADVWALVKLTVPAALQPGYSGHPLEVLSASLDCVVGDEDATQLDSQLFLARVPADAWGAIAEDATVKARAQELRVAVLQRRIREAALACDWGTVERLLAQAEKEARDNPWVEAALEALRKYAVDRDQQRLAKEARYMSERMNSRLVDAYEIPTFYDTGVESDKPAYLRKKREQGKRMDVDS